MKKIFKPLVMGVIIALTTVTVQAADYTIRATANSNENDEDYDGLVVFKNYVESASNGAIAVELFIGTQLCSKGAECLQGVADGSIDVYISTSGGAAGIFPYVQILDVPYLMSDDRIAEHVLSGDFTRKLRAMALKDSGNKIRLMTVGNTGGWRNFANTKRNADSLVWENAVNFPKSQFSWRNQSVRTKDRASASVEDPMIRLIGIVATESIQNHPGKLFTSIDPHSPNSMPEP